MIVKVIGEIRDGNLPAVFVGIPGEEQLVESHFSLTKGSGDLLTVISRKAAIEYTQGIKEQKAPPEAWNKIQSLIDDIYIPEFNTSYAKCVEQFGNGIVERILNGRVRMLNILNTPGGLVKAQEAINITQKNNVARGGETASYVLNKAASAGANIAMISQKRFLRSNAFMMFHPIISPGEKEGDEEYAERKRKGLVEIVSMLLEKADEGSKERVWRHCSEKIGEMYGEDPSAGPLDIIFSAKDLKKYGMVQGLFRTTEELKDHAMHSCPDMHPGISRKIGESIDEWERNRL